MYGGTATGAQAVLMSAFRRRRRRLPRLASCNQEHVTLACTHAERAPKQARAAKPPLACSAKTPDSASRDPGAAYALMRGASSSRGPRRMFATTRS